MDDMLSLIRDVEGLRRERIEDGVKVDKRLDELIRTVGALQDGFSDAVRAAVADCTEDPEHPLCRVITQIQGKAKKPVRAPLSEEERERIKHGHMSPDQALDCPTCGPKFEDTASMQPDVVARIVKKALQVNPLGMCELLGTCGYDKRPPPRPKSAF